MNHRSMCMRACCMLAWSVPTTGDAPTFAAGHALDPLDDTEILLAAQLLLDGGAASLRRFFRALNCGTTPGHGAGSYVGRHPDTPRHGVLSPAQTQLHQRHRARGW